jgi:hypothetical protein
VNQQDDIAQQEPHDHQEVIADDGTPEPAGEPGPVSANPQTIIIVVEPIRSGRFMARVDDRTVVTSSRQPFLDTARVLIARGHDPNTVVVMRASTSAQHAGSGVYALRGKLGTAARLTVDESKTRFRRWAPHPRSQATPPPAAALAGTHEATP